MKFVYPEEYNEVGLYDILKVKNLLEDLIFILNILYLK